MIGTKLAHYEITSHLGSGGMGDVYQATDSKLGRSVAIKLLPEAFTHDVERAARFEREARVLASLNHPNIAAIHGLEESDDRKFLVMELVGGETLAERLKRGPIPVEESLGIAKQICEALEAAHEKGIIHRDLKPANIKITTDGKVKVLDFGLAKAFESEPANTALSNSPTLSMAATNAGVVLGTAAYMSPEQAKGRTVDRRTDIFAFGCVLYEMLAGRAAFDGADIPDILSRILQRDPDWTLLPSETPPGIRALLRLCLEKNSINRRSDAADVRIDIDRALKEPEAAATSKMAPPALGRHLLAWSVAVLLGVASVAIAIAWSPWRTSSPAPLYRLSTELGGDVSLDSGGNDSALALSPDGSTLAFVGSKNGMTQIYVRRLGELEAIPLGGTEGARSPFFSPDGRWLGFFTAGQLKKISVTGGAAVTLCDVKNTRGGTWGDDGNIIFNPDFSPTVTLQRVSSAGGKPEPLTKLGQDEVNHRWPQVLPGGKGVLYSASNVQNFWDDANIVVQPLPSATPKIIVRGGYHAQYLPSGHLVYIHGGTLFAAPFDLDRLELAGQPIPAIDGVSAETLSASAQFTFSNTGTLAYARGQSVNNDAAILWMTRDGKTEPLRSTPSNWSNPKFSPDGRMLAMDIFDGRQPDVWIYEWARDTLTRLTFDPADDRKPVWTPDGQRIAFSSGRDKTTGNLYWERADGTGEIQRLTESPYTQVPGSWDPSGKYLAFTQTNPGGNDIMILPMEGDEKSARKPGKPTVFLNGPAVEQEPMFSPDGRWIAYESNESGQNEVFVRRFPGPGGKWQVSTGGGNNPVWSQARHELFYKGAYRIMVASYTVDGDSFKADKPRLSSDQPILTRPRQRSFDIHPDGDRFAVSAATGPLAEDKRDKVVFIFNFFDELRRIAPPSKK